MTNIIKRRRGEWVEVFAGEAGSLRLPVEHAPSTLTVGARLEWQQWAVLRSESDFHVAYDRALRLLGRREHFAVELRRKLAERCPDRDIIARVLAACEQRGYLSDERAAEYTCQRLLSRGGMGKLRLKSELLARGAGAELAEQMLATHGAALDEPAACRELLMRRRASFAAKLSRMRSRLDEAGADPRRLGYSLRSRLGAQVASFVYSRGFGDDDARRIARRLVDELVEEELQRKV